jgi:hypothetical protein
MSQFIEVPGGVLGLWDEENRQHVQARIEGHENGIPDVAVTIEDGRPCIQVRAGVAFEVRTVTDNADIMKKLQN